MPDPYPNARYLPTNTARNAVHSLGISIDSAIYVVKNYEIRHPGRSSGQWWYLGRDPGGDSLRVLVREDPPAHIILITFHRQQ